MTIRGYCDRLCPKCRTYTQHVIIIPRQLWRCLNCDTEHGRTPRKGDT